jgi:DNA polymerase-1
MNGSLPGSSSRLLIVDGHAFAYRAFHAIRQLSSPSGAPTNAIYGFIKMLDKMQANLSPSHLLVVWDGGLAAERIAALPEYKTQRPPMPMDLGPQIAGLQRYLEASRIPFYCEDGVEADDWIAAITRRAMAAGLPVVIASADKDFMQLVCSDKVGMLNPNDKSEKIWTPEDVREKTGVAPEQIVDWLSLIGDSVDNIPGVPGVGTKTATALLQQFGSVDSLYARLQEVKSDKLRANLHAAAEAVQRNKRLIKLKEDFTDVWPLEKTLLQPPELSPLRALYAEWGFKTMLAQTFPSEIAQPELL